MPKERGFSIRTAKARYPHVPDEILQKMVDQHSYLLTAAQREQLVKLVRNGMTSQSTLAMLHIQEAAYKFTRQAFPDFAKAVKDAIKGRTKWVETKLFESIIGKAYEVKTTKLALRDANGMNVLDKNGKPVYISEKKEIKQLSPSIAALQFYLKSHMASVYGDDKKIEAAGSLPSDALRNDVAAKLQDFIKKKKA